MAANRAGAAGQERLRADARRNYDALLAAGHEVFTAHGVDAPFDDVARRAGVGRATLYRHFPTREHLFAALVRDRLGMLEQRARELAGAAGARRAVEDWLRLYHRSVRYYSGMSARLAEAIGTDADPAGPVPAACAPMRAEFGRLYTGAQHAGAIRPDITADQALTLVAALPGTYADDPADPFLTVVMAGLRAGLR